MMNTMLEQIKREAEADPRDSRKIPASLVRGWMVSDDPDVRGAAYAFFSSPHTARIQPELSFDEIFDFTLNYYEWCIKTDSPPGGWVNTRYSAGWDLVSWFASLWHQDRDKSYFERIKDRLAKLYKAGDADLRKSIEHAIIEHLFERKQIRKFFADWKDDADLKAAYAEGMLWVTHGGSSPLTESSEKSH